MDLAYEVNAPFPTDQGLLGRLLTDTGKEWLGLVRHPFFQRLRVNAFSSAEFQEFLVQDFIGSFHRARTYALLAFRTRTLSELRSRLATLAEMVDDDIPVHTNHSTRWGMTLEELETAPNETPQTIALTRFVLDLAMTGDALEFELCMMPCMLGYAQARHALRNHPAIHELPPLQLSWVMRGTGRKGRERITRLIENFERLGRDGRADQRYDRLLRIFRQVVALEVAFLDAIPRPDPASRLAVTAP